MEEVYTIDEARRILAEAVREKSLRVEELEAKLEGLERLADDVADLIETYDGLLADARNKGLA